MKYAIGIDNGVTGTIGIIANEYSVFVNVPVVNQYDYTKKVKKINRVDCPKVIELFKTWAPDASQAHCIIERPFVNPKMFNATMSSVRACEAIQIILESLSIPYSFIDSKEWQKVLLPFKSFSSDVDTKDRSKHVGVRLFPQHEALINKHKDADGLLIAEYCRRKFNTLI